MYLEPEGMLSLSDLGFRELKYLCASVHVAERRHQHSRDSSAMSCKFWAANWTIDYDVTSSYCMGRTISTDTPIPI